MDELERQLGDHLEVIRVNAQEDVGRDLAKFYDFRFTPTFIFFDAEGQELWREVSNIDPQRVRESLE